MSVLFVGFEPTPGVPNSRTFDGDVRDRAALESALTGVREVVYHPDPDITYESDAVDVVSRGGYVLATAAAELGVERMVLLSTLRFFRRLPTHWKLSPDWRPRPTTDLNELLPFIAELSLREITRSTTLHSTCLRLGDHVSKDDRAAAIQAALTDALPSSPHSWRIYHVGEPSGRPEDTTTPWQKLLAPSKPTAPIEIKRVVILGAGGPVSAALATELKTDYSLRLCDIRPISEIATEGVPQFPGAPLPVPLGSPHECVVTDVRKYDQVRAACEGMDAIIQCTVLRTDPVDAFLVNTVGAFHAAKAAAELGIQRLVQTGPMQYSLHNENDYSWDYEVTDDAPARPGRHLYGHSKYLGQEIVRIFAEEYGLVVPNLLFCLFTDPELYYHFHPMIVSWPDCARAIRGGLETQKLPSPYEEFYITTDLPHGRFRTNKAKSLLDWAPHDPLYMTWQQAHR